MNDTVAVADDVMSAGLRFPERIELGKVDTDIHEFTWAVFKCSDGRFSTRVAAAIREIIGDFDPIVKPGTVFQLVEVIKDFHDLAGLHNLKGALIIEHIDCGYYKANNLYPPHEDTASKEEVYKAKVTAHLRSMINFKNMVNFLCSTGTIPRNIHILTYLLEFDDEGNTYLQRHYL